MSGTTRHEDDEPAPGPEPALDHWCTRLVGLRAELVVSDPWELVDQDGQNRLHTLICDVEPVSNDESPTLLLRLEQPVSWRGRRYTYLVASARQDDEWRRSLQLGQSLACRAVGVSDHDAAGAPPWGADHWRGGLALIGQLTPGFEPGAARPSRTV